MSVGGGTPQTKMAAYLVMGGVPPQTNLDPRFELKKFNWNLKIRRYEV